MIKREMVKCSHFKPNQSKLPNTGTCEFQVFCARGCDENHVTLDASDKYIARLEAELEKAEKMAEWLAENTEDYSAVKNIEDRIRWRLRDARKAVEKATAEMQPCPKYPGSVQRPCPYAPCDECKREAAQKAVEKGGER